VLSPGYRIEVSVIPLRISVIAAVAAAGLAVTGCSQANSGKSSSPTPSAGSTRSTVTPSTSASRTSSAAPSPTATQEASFGGTCDDLLPVSRIDDALGRPVIGTTAFIVGVPEPAIGRQAYLNCRYGVTKPVKGKRTPPPQIEIGISLYGSPTQATRRVQGTLENFRASGATPTQTSVGQYPATILLGYGSPTIVVAAGPRTVAITAVASVLSLGRDKALVALGKAAVDATDRFTQSGPVPATSGSASGSASVSATDSPTG
jgi:hypothetical protein